MVSFKRVAKGVAYGISGLFLLGSIASGFSSDSPATANLASSPAVLGDQATPVPTPDVETKLVSETEDIPYTTTYTTDALLTKGLTTTKTFGISGLRTLTYRVTLTDGLQTDKQLVSNTVTFAPVDEVIARGTYVAPSYSTGTGYYNTYGDYVPSPTYSGGAPAGGYNPSATCADGTTSYSQSRSGTCSHHGGVATWY